MRRITALLLSLFLVAACDDDPAAVDTSHVGTYQLQTVNGAALPVSLVEDGEVITVSSGSLVLGANETFSINLELSFTADDQTTSETILVSGSYARTDNTVDFDHGGDDTGFETATVSGDLLTTTGGGGEVLVFRRQN